MDQTHIEDPEEICIECMRIKCKQCGWVAGDADVNLIQKGEMTVCPICSWSPSVKE